MFGNFQSGLFSGQAKPAANSFNPFARQVGGLFGPGGMFGPQQQVVPGTAVGHPMGNAQPAAPQGPTEDQRLAALGIDRRQLPSMGVTATQAVQGGLNNEQLRSNALAAKGIAPPAGMNAVQTLMKNKTNEDLQNEMFAALGVPPKTGEAARRAMVSRNMSNLVNFSR